VPICLRYCARPPIACARLRQAGSELVYRCGKQHSEPGSAYVRGAKSDELYLTPLELIDRIAALIPPPPKPPAHYLWAVLIARIYEVFPLVCPICGGPMHITSLHYLQRRHPTHSRPHRGGIRAAPHVPGTRAAAVG
jgi:hypothetical protein